MSLREVWPEVFGTYFETARKFHLQIADATSPFEHREGTCYFLDEDPETGFCGYAIRPDGELVFVWSARPGRGNEIVEHAVANGATHLDCFDGYLPSLYARHGFVEYARENNWTPDGPDVVYMRIESAS